MKINYTCKEWICPLCKSKNVSSIGEPYWTVEGDYMMYDALCEECGAKFNLFCQLEVDGVGNVVDKNGNEYETDWRN